MLYHKLVTCSAVQKAGFCSIWELTQQPTTGPCAKCERHWSTWAFVLIVYTAEGVHQEHLRSWVEGQQVSVFGKPTGAKKTHRLSSQEESIGAWLDDIKGCFVGCLKYQQKSQSEKKNLRVSHSLFTSGCKTSKVTIEKREKKPFPVLFFYFLRITSATVLADVF